MDRGPDLISEQPMFFSLIADSREIWEDLKSNRGTWSLKKQIDGKIHNSATMPVLSGGRRPTLRSKPC